MATLKRRLTFWGFSRSRKSSVTMEQIYEAVKKELESENQNLGYRKLTHVLLLKYKLHAKRYVWFFDSRHFLPFILDWIVESRDQVAEVLRSLDPVGVGLRKAGRLKRRIYYSPGPNDSWCFDGHDKLVKYYIAIHGCVDAWSGKWMWLNVFTSNHDPRVVALHYLRAVKLHGGTEIWFHQFTGLCWLINNLCSVFPLNTRTDCGTETIITAALQAGLHELYQTWIKSQQSHSFVPSTRNVKIESGWSRFLKAKGHALIDILDHGFHDSRFNPNNQLDKYWWGEHAWKRCIKISFRYIYLYVWMPLIQTVLDDFVTETNTKVLLQLLILNASMFSYSHAASPKPAFYLAMLQTFVMLLIKCMMLLIAAHLLMLKWLTR